VRPVVGGVDAPVVAGAEVVTVADAVHDRVAQGHVLALHVDLRPQDARSVRELAGLHAPEQVEVLLDAAAAVGALRALLAEAAPLGRDGLGVGVVHVGESLADQVLGPGVQLAEVVGGVQQPRRVETQPFDVGDDRFDVLRLLGVGVRVVEAQVADAPELLRRPEVDRDGLGVTDVQVAVGLRREPGLDPSAVGLLLVVPANDVADEVVGNGLGHGRKVITPGVGRLPGASPSGRGSRPWFGKVGRP